METAEKADKRDVQRNSFHITINNPLDHGFSREQIRKILIESFPTLDYFCAADEVATTGTPHTHLYVHFRSRVRWSKIAKHFPGMHIEEAKGSPSQNRAYIRKDGEKYADKKETSVEGTFEEWGHSQSKRETIPSLPL